MSYYANLSGAKVKVSSLAGALPGNELEESELAVNIADGNIFVKHHGIIQNLTTHLVYKQHIMNESRFSILESQLVALQLQITKLTPTKPWLDEEADSYEKVVTCDK